MRLIAVTSLLLAIAAAPAAASWSPTKGYDPAPAACRKHTRTVPIDCVGEPAPRVAVNPSGAAVAVWRDLRDRVRAAVADRAGHFGAAATLSDRGLQPTVAITPDGTATAIWTDATGTLRFARRRAGQSFGHAARLVARGSKQEDSSAKAAGQPDGSVLVIYTSPFRGPSGQYVERLRSVRLSAGGHPGALTELGRGSFGHDSTRVAADGTLAACCVRPALTSPDQPPATASMIAVFRPGIGWKLISVAALGGDAIETVFATRSELALGTLHVEQGGDAGVLGIPGVARAGADGPLAATLRVPIRRKDRGLAPNVTIDGSGRSVLLFQEKTKAQAFSRTAPVYASVGAADAASLPTRQRLDARLAYEPAVRPYGQGAIGVWQAPGQRWGAAIETTGTFHPIPGPSGLGPSTLGEDFNLAYDLETNGAHAVLAWGAGDGSIRVSELK